MPKLIPIRGSAEIRDPFYRYKMEEVELIKQGPAKMAFTNIDSICGSLKRDPKLLIAYLKKYFASAFEYKNNMALTSIKDLTKDKLQTGIYNYIDKYILCQNQNCHNPETDIMKDKGGDYLVCKACGAKSYVK